MYFLLSGEGPTDMGSAGLTRAMICEGKDFKPGPMAVMADQIVAKRLGRSMLESGCCGYIAETHLCKKSPYALKPVKKSQSIPGKHKPKETHYFFSNARTLARFAQDKKKERNDEVIAILFRDSACKASAGRGTWDAKWQSMLDGFREEEFSKGVPMLPKPKSEAWLICALKKNPYQGCDALEDRSGNDASPKSLKKELEGILDEPATDDLLCEKVHSKAVDVDKIQMPSFKAFRERLEEIIK
jgi:hypothetical protein